MSPIPTAVLEAATAVPIVAAIPPPPLQSISLGPIDLRMYGLLIAIGAYLALQLLVRRHVRFGGQADLAEKAGLLALAGGFVGGRIGYVLPRLGGPDGYLQRPLEIFAIWQGGLAFFGGLAGGALAAILYVRWRRGSVPRMADAIAPALPLAQAIGRWGNYFNQELYGRPTDLAWALRVDPVPLRTAQQYPGATTFHPTFLYESLWNAALVVVILLVERAGWLHRRGSLLFVYLIGYGVGRGWIEALRIDTVERYLGLSRNNWIAIAVVLIGVLGLVASELRPVRPERDEALPLADAEGEALPPAHDHPSDGAHDGPSDGTHDEPSDDADDPARDDADGRPDDGR